MRDMVEKCRDKDLQKPIREFVDTQESICTSYDKSNVDMYYRWKKERDKKNE